MNDQHSLPLTSSHLDDVEASLQYRGWGVYTEAGLVCAGVVDTEAISELCRAFGSPSPRDGGVDLWPVRPRTSDPGQTFSQRAGDAGLHTDAAYHDDPEPRFALICVRPAADGGYTRLLAASDITRGLDPLVEQRLQVPQWRWRAPEIFGGGLSGRHGVLAEDSTVRWRSDNLVIPGDLERTAATFATHLESHPMLVQLLLPADSVLICDNRRVLHGRTTFTDRQRWLIRVRLAQR